MSVDSEQLTHLLAVFQLSASASLAEIKRAYREMSRLHHPDQFANDPSRYERAVEKQKQINSTYTAICKLLEEGISPSPTGAAPADKNQAKNQGNAAKAAPTRPLSVTELCARARRLETGENCQTDVVAAVRLYERAAQMGSVDAMFRLGCIYMTSIYRNHGLAFGYFKQASLLGHISATFNLGLFYERGVGVSIDLAKAIELYKKAAAAGDAGARKKLQTLGVKEDACGQLRTPTNTFASFVKKRTTTDD